LTDVQRNSIPFARHPKYEEACARCLGAGCVAFAWNAAILNQALPCESACRGFPTRGLTDVQRNSIPFTQYPKYEEACARCLGAGCVALAWKAAILNQVLPANVPVGASRPRMCLSGLPDRECACRGFPTSGLRGICLCLLRGFLLKLSDAWQETLKFHLLPRIC